MNIRFYYTYKNNISRKMFLSRKKVIFILAVKTKCLYLSRKRRQTAPQHKKWTSSFYYTFGLHCLCPR